MSKLVFFLFSNNYSINWSANGLPMQAINCLCLIVCLLLMHPSRIFSPRALVALHFCCGYGQTAKFVLGICFVTTDSSYVLPVDRQFKAPTPVNFVTGRILSQVRSRTSHCKRAPEQTKCTTCPVCTVVAQP